MVFVWSFVELGVTLIVASAPLLRSLGESIMRGTNPFKDTHSAQSDKGYPSRQSQMLRLSGKILFMTEV